MTKNAEVGRIFHDIADLLDLQGEERFKPEAYRRAARSIEALGEDIAEYAARGELSSIPGIGAALEEKIREYLRDGQVGYYERLRAQVPAGLLEIMRIPGVGPKTARRFLLELEVRDPAALSAAIAAGRLDGLKGFGPRKIALLREGLASLRGRAPEVRRPILLAWELAERVAADLRASRTAETVVVAGSLRRGRATIGDIDLLATAVEGAAVFDAFSGLPGVTEVRLRGDTKETVIFAPGMQIDLRVVPPESFGAALQYFTGSKDHNIRLRTIARDLGLKINEYGVYRDETRIAGRTEEEVYGALGLPWIPAELREDRGEIEAAQGGHLPALVEEADLRGDLHLHLADPARADLAAWTAAARALGLQYLGFVLDEGEATSETVRALRQRWERTPEAGPLELLVGVEGTLEEPPHLAPGFDYWVGRPGTGTPPGPAAREPPPLLFAHLPEPGSEARRSWTAWARGEGVPLEVNPGSPPDGLEPGELTAGLGTPPRIFVSSGASAPEQLVRLRLAVRIARRGSAPKGSVENTGRPGRGPG